MQDRIYYLIHYLFISTWSEQEEDVVATMRNILILTINEMDNIPKSILTFLLNIHEQEGKNSSTIGMLIRDLFIQCERKLKPHLKKTEQINEVDINTEDGNQKMFLNDFMASKVSFSPSLSLG